jgi:acetyltransferase-like isoleucine patch superfamily enzyme
MLRDKVAVVDERDAAQLVAVWRQFQEGAQIGANVRVGLAARLVNLGDAANARIAGDSVIRGVLRLEPRGQLEIGRFCYVGDGVLISAQERINIGEATLLAHGVQVFDNNSHPVSAAQRELQFQRMMGHKQRNGPIEIDSAPVSIGRRCWIGLNSIVMKGVTIGDDTIVAAGSVVVDNLPKGVVAAGNPARILRELDPSESPSP